MKPRHPIGVQDDPAGQHSHVARHVVSPGAQVSGSHAPRMHDSHRPQEGLHSLGSHS